MEQNRLPQMTDNRRVFVTLVAKPHCSLLAQVFRCSPLVAWHPVHRDNAMRCRQEGSRFRHYRKLAEVGASLARGGVQEMCHLNSTRVMECRADVNLVSLGCDSCCWSAACKAWRVECDFYKAESDIAAYGSFELESDRVFELQLAVESRCRETAGLPLGLRN